MSPDSFDLPSSSSQTFPMFDYSCIFLKSCYLIKFCKHSCTCFSEKPKKKKKTVKIQVLLTFEISGK